MEDEEELLVSVDDEHLESLSEVTDHLTRAGMRVDRTLPEIGTVIGVAPAGALERLKGVRGVSAVSPARGFQAPPPDAEVQ